MVSTLEWFYLVGTTVLFFFWVYGIVSFVLDVKNIYVPVISSILAERREAARKAEQEEAREEAERQLY